MSKLHAFVAVALSVGLGVGVAPASEPEVEVVEIPYDPAHPDAPLKAVITIADEPGVPTLDAAPEVVPNPFAHAREAYLAQQAAAAAPPVDDRFVPDVAVRAPSLTLPPKQACLTASATEDDGVSIEGRGLSAAQVRTAVGAFLPRAAACVPRGTRGSFTVRAAFRVGCDGRVSEVHVVDAGGFPAGVATCIETALRYAPFPAHDQQGGAGFEVPLQFKG